MENIVLTIQAAYDLVLAGLLLYWHLDNKKQKDWMQDARIQSFLNDMKLKTLQIEKETVSQKKEVEENLKRLLKVIDKVNRALPVASMPSQQMTEEEKEIRNLLREDIETIPTIPSILELEKTRSPLREDAPLDLKAVLRSQLC